MTSPGQGIPIPVGHHTLTPVIVVSDVTQAVEFYEKAFAGNRLDLHHVSGTLRLASIRIGDSILLVEGDLPYRAVRAPQPERSSTSLTHIYTENVDVLWERAIAAGGRVSLPLHDAFWGERYGQLVDPFHHRWSLSSRTENLSTEEVQRRMQERWTESETHRALPV